MLLLQPRENLDFQEYQFITLFFYFSRAGILLSLQLYVIFHTFKTLHNLFKKKFFFSNDENKFAFISFFFFSY